MFPDISTVQTFLEQFGEALSSGETPVVGAFFAVPAVFVHDGGASAATRPGELEELVADLGDQAHGIGRHVAWPIVARLEALSGELLGVDVDWVGRDADGRPSGRQESYRYVLRHRPGRLAIQVVIKRTDAHVTTWIQR